MLVMGDNDLAADRGQVVSFILIFYQIFIGICEQFGNGFEKTCICMITFDGVIATHLACS